MAAKTSLFPPDRPKILVEFCEAHKTRCRWILRWYPDNNSIELLWEWLDGDTWQQWWP